LGRIYYECPGWPLSEGNIHESLEHLSKAVALAPENSTNHLFLAETLLKLGKKEEAHLELEQVLKATRHAHCPQHLEEDRREARRLLSKKW
jgi:thioredoxin-like negative regulator of GroEL